MAGQFEKPITIRQAIRNIDDRSFLLPAIQRNFVWSTAQICTLFDSMMRMYPINTFMMWDVSSKEIKDKYRFYSFLSNYCERFKESNDHVPTQGEFKDFKAIIDGQQRLTSIYIGLKGSYAYKRPRIWWPNTRNDDALPPRHLHLNLTGPVKGEEDESMSHFDFRFLTKEQVSSAPSDGTEHWFRVGSVLSLPDVRSLDEITDDAVMPYLAEHGLAENKFARKTLSRLYYLVRHEEVIHFFNEESQEIDHVLEVFIRTNSGGTPLAFSDLLMSIAIANWDGDARKDIDDLVTEVRQSSEMQFSIGRDWVLKTCLMLTGADVRFKVKNFDAGQVNLIQTKWKGIRDCIVETFKMIRRFGLNDQSLRAKNAVIPLAFYLYKQSFEDKPLFESINNLKHLHEERSALSRWLHMALLKGVFGGHSDGVLSKMQRLLTENLCKSAFPMDEIVNAFTATNKDLRFDEAYLKGLLDIEYEDSRSRSVLSLLFPEINENLQLDIDHLHPKSAFTKAALDKQGFLQKNDDLFAFYLNPLNWNSIANLHLLNASQNRSKNDTALKDWLADSQCGIKPTDILLKETDSLSFEDFKAFCTARREALLKRLRLCVVVSGQSPVTVEPIDTEEEVETVAWAEPRSDSPYPSVASINQIDQLRNS